MFFTKCRQIHYFYTALFNNIIRKTLVNGKFKSIQVCMAALAYKKNKKPSMKNSSRFVMLSLLTMCITLMVNGQSLSGVVFRDFNGNGTKDNTASFNEPFVSGITVKVYNAINAQVGPTKPRRTKPRVQGQGGACTRVRTGVGPLFARPASGTPVRATVRSWCASWRRRVCRAACGRPRRCAPPS